MPNCHSQQNPKTAAAAAGAMLAVVREHAAAGSVGYPKPAVPEVPDQAAAAAAEVDEMIAGALARVGDRLGNPVTGETDAANTTTPPYEDTPLTCQGEPHVQPTVAKSPQ